jgi:hypothetical protein
VGGVGVLRTVLLWVLAAVVVTLVVLAIAIPGFGRIPARPIVAPLGGTVTVEINLANDRPAQITVTEVQLVSAAQREEWRLREHIVYRVPLEGADIYLVRFESDGADLGGVRSLWRLADVDGEVYTSTILSMPPEADCEGIEAGCAIVIVPEGTEIASARYYGVNPGRRVLTGERWAEWLL